MEEPEHQCVSILADLLTDVSYHLFLILVEIQLNEWPVRLAHKHIKHQKTKSLKRPAAVFRLQLHFSIHMYLV